MEQRPASMACARRAAFPSPACRSWARRLPEVLLNEDLLLDRISARVLTASPNVGPRLHRRIGRPDCESRLAIRDAARARLNRMSRDLSRRNDRRNRLRAVRYPSRDPASVSDHGPAMRLLEHAATSLADEDGAIGRRGRRGQHLVVFQHTIIAAMGTRNVETTAIGSVIKIADLAFACHSGR